MTRVQPQDFVKLWSPKKGHFTLESGHHGDVWMDLEALCSKPNEIRPFAEALAVRLSKHQVEAVCGALNEGAFVALMVASALDVEFAYAERFANPKSDALFPVEYRVPRVLRDKVRGKRVAIVNDVINAGSAVRGALRDLEICGANVVAIGALLVLGSSASRLAADNHVALEAGAQLENSVWLPSECPLCAAQVPLEAYDA